MNLISNLLIYKEENYFLLKKAIDDQGCNSLLIIMKDLINSIID